MQVENKTVADLFVKFMSVCVHELVQARKIIKKLKFYISSQFMLVEIKA